MDISCHVDEELKVHAVATSNEGQSFIDSYLPDNAAEMVVVDSGRIVLQQKYGDSFVEKARERGLTVAL